ncbi:mitogen-activated protein kinase kinase kinase 17 [Selaginella moellendorffii]|uniref:mitogen-activated protein kinase kinase kinase 17 n=1 Tax=Selaginella moellendorffii TaxID=88036 RepID=UPI000D1C3DE1|nr:mitogen-activated protein kinase kinase kinase 17 [Selaginella moellendorffii]|eukprot:XP_024527893.1 mitogen-activated protein kinase kinase kinase 17 [Selaginella moellendorffii]
MADRVVRSWVCGGLIGAGAFGSVNLAVDNETGDLFAVKSTECSGGRSSDGALLALENELSILQSLQSSPRIVKCLGSAWSSSAESGQPVRSVFLEYMPGGSIADLMAKLGGKLHESLARIYTRGILEGLEFLHRRGIVHCDIKGKNVLVGATGVKLADFGAAKRLSGAAHYQHHQQSPMIKGTPLWMAPEVVRQEEQGTASDIWSLGCTVLEMITGRAPWGDVKHTFSALYRIGCSEELPELPWWLSEQGKDFVMNCLRRDPRERWTSAQLLQHPFVMEAMESPSPSLIAAPRRASAGDLDSVQITKLLADMPVVAEEEEEKGVAEAAERRRLVRPRLEVCGNWDDQGHGSDPGMSPSSAGGKWIVVRSPQGGNNWNLPDPFNLLSDFESGEDGEVVDASSDDDERKAVEVELEVEDQEEEEEEEEEKGVRSLESSPVDHAEEEASSSSTSSSSCGLVFCYEFWAWTNPQPKFYRASLLQQEGHRIGFPPGSSSSSRSDRRPWQCGKDPPPRRRKKNRSRKKKKKRRRRRGRWIIAAADGDDELGLPDSCVECKSRKRLALFLLLFDSSSRRWRKKKKSKRKSLSSNRKNSSTLWPSPVF